MISSVRKVIDNYYKARKYKNPTAIEALLWLISEIGELTEAITRVMVDKADNGDFDGDVHSEGITNLLVAVWELKLKADGLLMRQDGWVRNHSKPAIVKESVAGEVADVFMMLDRVASEMGCPEVVECLFAKMKEKGYAVGRDDGIGA